MQRARERGAFQSLAEPNLIAYNGQEASFLAGGEFPVPVVQGATGSVTVEFKEFGIRLTFTPTIAGDVIRLKVAPEVSALDFANGRQPRRLPDPGADDPPRRDRRRAARRPVVRHRRSARQHLAGRPGGHSVPEPDSDHRHAVQEQGRTRRADRADGADHAPAGAAAGSRRGAAAADPVQAVHCRREVWATRAGLVDAPAASAASAQLGAGERNKSHVTTVRGIRESRAARSSSTSRLPCSRCSPSRRSSSTTA